MQSLNPRYGTSAQSRLAAHTVESHSRTVDGPGSEHGLTFSAETAAATPAAQAEYDVLRAILQRENYLQRLHGTVRTVGRRFKPEVADCLDLVRAASLEVVDCVGRWRSAKGDDSAAFMWNGVDYLLKMPSDLDYLAEYLAVQSWMGFPLERNPFCVPFALEKSALVNKDGEPTLTQRTLSFALFEMISIVVRFSRRRLFGPAERREGLRGDGRLPHRRTDESLLVATPV